MAKEPDTSISLPELRDEIDRLDKEILDRLNERARCALEVAEVKMRDSNGEAPVFYRPEREAQVLRRMREINEGPLTDEKVGRIYREIIQKACCVILVLRLVNRFCLMGDIRSP